MNTVVVNTLIFKNSTEQNCSKPLFSSQTSTWSEVDQMGVCQWWPLNPWVWKNIGL